MAGDDKKSEGLPVPKRRLTRLARFGGLGASIAGNMALEGAQRLARGERPSLQELALTPSNAAKAAEQLSRMRGAAMKLGQLVSMDSGDFLPPEVANLLAPLRNGAHHMPPHQLKAQLNAAWGRNWLRQFKSFDVRPIAAASIGQVHQAVAKDGRKLAIKIQYPGVRESIDSDIDNLMAIIRLSGMLPKDVDLGPIIDETKKQLASEADYELEAKRLNAYRAMIKNLSGVGAPEAHDDLTTPTTLAMSYVDGVPIDAIADASQEDRDRLAYLLIDLTFKELFEFNAMQTDPNFANFLYDEHSGVLNLIDFGALREIEPDFAEGYRALLSAASRDHWPDALAAGQRMGLVAGDIPPDIERLLRESFELATAPLRQEGVFDFGATTLAAALRDKVFELRTAGFLHPPPPPAVFIHRKFGGLYLIATRLRARIDLRTLIAPYIN